VAETAELAAVSERTVWRWIDAGRLPAKQPAGPGTAVRIDPEELEHFLSTDPIERLAERFHVVLAGEEQR
jgi:excisionase family DNA binding protein